MLNGKDKIEEEKIDLKKQKLYYDKLLLRLEFIIGISTIVLFVLLVLLASFVDMSDEARLMIVFISTIFLVIMCMVMLKIEQVAGYYECNKCHHKYVPTYNKVLWAMHINRIRYLKCPECNKYSWSKKVLNKQYKVDVDKNE